MSEGEIVFPTSIHTVVFFGDSVTAAHRDLERADSLGDGYVRAIADRVLPTSGASRVVNLGIGGNRIQDLRARWGEVESAAPDLLTVLIGINDVWRHFDRGMYTSSDSFRADLRAILERADELRTTVVLMEPFLVPVTDQQVDWLPELSEKIAIINELGAATDVPVIHLQDLMRSAAAATNPTELAPDGIHPTALGHRLIAQAWLGEMSLRYRDPVLG